MLSEFAVQQVAAAQADPVVKLDQVAAPGALELLPHGFHLSARGIFPGGNLPGFRQELCHFPPQDWQAKVIMSRLQVTRVLVECCTLGKQEGHDRQLR